MVVNVYDTATYPAPELTLLPAELRTVTAIPSYQVPQISVSLCKPEYLLPCDWLNSTPVLLNIPVDSAAAGVRYIHNWELIPTATALLLTHNSPDETKEMLQELRI
jgi:hypothetical protein